MNALLNAFKSLRRSILTIALLFVGLALSTETAAQPQQEGFTPEEVLSSNPEVCQNHPGDQFAALLTSPVRQVREDALPALILAARTQPCDLRATVPALLGIYDGSRHFAERHMAVTALRAIGDEEGIKALIPLAEKEHDEKMRRHVRINIADYYLTMYPALEARWKKSKQISYARIERAKRQQERALRKGKVALAARAQDR